MSDDLPSIDLAAPLDESRWSSWRLDRSRLELRYPTAYTGKKGSSAYSIKLERCTSAAELVDVIFAVAARPWAARDPAIVGGLVIALADLLHPQACLCSRGQDKHITPEDIRNIVSASVSDQR